MKKLILCASFMLCSLSTFAYYRDSETSGFVTFLGLLMVVWGVLNIILFFKIWIATNDINAIKKKYIDNSTTLSRTEFKHKIFMLQSKGKTEEASKLLEEMVDKEIAKHIYKEPTSEGDTAEIINKDITEIKTYYTKYYKLLGVEFPKYLDNLTVEKYVSYSNALEESNNTNIEH